MGLGGVTLKTPDMCLIVYPFNSASELVKNAHFFRDWDTFTPRPWLPVVDVAFTNDPFLTEHPFMLASGGYFNKMPIVFGCAKDEGTLQIILKFVIDPLGQPTVIAVSDHQI